MIWTPEQDAALRAALEQRMTATQAAAHLSQAFKVEITRNAVIGRASRRKMKICGASLYRNAIVPHPRQPQAKADRKGGVAFSKLQPLPMPEAPPEPEPAPVAEIAMPESRRVKLVALTPGMCRWPMGDPRHDAFCFCAADRAGDGPYCGYHTARARGAATVKYSSERLRAVKAGRAKAALARAAQ